MALLPTSSGVWVTHLPRSRIFLLSRRMTFCYWTIPQMCGVPLLSWKTKVHWVIHGQMGQSSHTWSETYFRQDLFPSYLFSRRQFHAIVIFRLKSISDLNSGSLPRFFGEFIYMKIKIVMSQQRLDVKWPKYARQWIGLGFELGLG